MTDIESPRNDVLRLPENVTVVPSEFFDELTASLDEPAVPSERTRDAFRRLGEEVERR